jgi:hypothetical protein
MTLGGVEIERFRNDSGTKGLVINTAGDVQIEGAGTLIFLMDALTVVVQWNGTAYTGTDVTAADYLTSKVGAAVTLMAP